MTLLLEDIVEQTILHYVEEFTDIQDKHWYVFFIYQQPYKIFIFLYSIINNAIQPK
jgi:hypothetical protein